MNFGSIDLKEDLKYNKNIDLSKLNIIIHIKTKTNNEECLYETI